MRNDVFDLIKELKHLLLKGQEMDIDTLQYEAESLYHFYSKRVDKLLDNGIFDIEGAKEFDGLYKKLKRAYPIETTVYDRDEESCLAEELDFGFPFEEDEVRYVDEDVLTRIQKNITNFIANRSVSDPYENDPEFADILIKQKPIVYVEQDDLLEMASGLKGITTSFVQYIENYRPARWRWGIDLIVISQYLFELMVEITYKTISGEDLDHLKYDIRQAFTYHKANVPELMERAINESVVMLEELLSDTIDYVEKHDYHKLEYEAWLRPIFYNIGILGIKFALEHHSERD